MAGGVNYVEWCVRFPLAQTEQLNTPIVIS